VSNTLIYRLQNNNTTIIIIRPQQGSGGVGFYSTTIAMYGPTDIMKGTSRRNRTLLFKKYNSKVSYNSYHAGSQDNKGMPFEDLSLCRSSDSSDLLILDSMRVGPIKWQAGTCGRAGQLPQRSSSSFDQCCRTGSPPLYLNHVYSLESFPQFRK
jgi:hypothetical protein